MWNTLFSMAITALATLAFAQHIQLETMNERLNARESQQADLQAELQTTCDSTALLGVLVSDNRRRIDDMRRKRTLTVSAYSPRECETDSTPYITAGNRPVRHGIVAVSRDLFKKGWVFGKKVYISGLGIFTIDDLMARHKRNQVDIFMFETDRALQFGKKRLDVVLLDA